MKRKFGLFILIFLLLIGLSIFVTSNSGNQNEQIVGASCGTVSPGYQDECCVNKGYQGWDEENFKCIGEEEKEKNQNQISAVNAYKKVNLTQTQIRKIIQARNRIRAYYTNLSECPANCTCSGSTVKCFFGNGTRIMTIYAGKSGNVIVQVKNVNMSTNVTLYKNENGTIYGVFKGNRTHEIILPDDVIEKLKERNQKRLQLYNTSINLTEEGYYQVQTKKKARLFLLIPVRERIRAQIDAETGEIIKIRNPWWGFLARDIRE